MKVHVVVVRDEMATGVVADSIWSTPALAKSREQEIEREIDKWAKGSGNEDYEGMHDPHVIEVDTDYTDKGRLWF